MKKRKNHWRKIASLIMMGVCILSAPKEVLATTSDPSYHYTYDVLESPTVTLIDGDGKILPGAKRPLDSDYDKKQIVPLNFLGTELKQKTASNPDGNVILVKGRWGGNNGNLLDKGAILQVNEIGTYKGKKLSVQLEMLTRVEVTIRKHNFSIGPDYQKVSEGIFGVKVKPIYEDGTPLIVDENTLFLFSDTSGGAPIHVDHNTGKRYQSTVVRKSYNGLSGIDNILMAMNIDRLTPTYDPAYYFNYKVQYTADKQYLVTEERTHMLVSFMYVYPYNSDGLSLWLDFKNMPYLYEVYSPDLNIVASGSRIPLKIINDTPRVINTTNKKNNEVFIQVDQVINRQGFDHLYSDEFKVSFETSDLIPTKGNEDKIRIIDLFGNDYTENATIRSNENGKVDVTFSKKDMKKIVETNGSKVIQLQGEFPINYLDPRLDDYSIGDGVYRFDVTAKNTDIPDTSSQGTATFDPGGPLGKGVPQVVNVGTSTDDLDATKLVTDLFSPYGVDDAEVAVDNGKGGFSKKTTFKTSDNEVQVELRSKKYPNKKNLVSVPIKVEEVVFDIEDNFLLGSGETYLKTDKEITKLVNDNMKFSAKTKTGEKIDDVEVYKTDIPNNDVGKFDVYVRAFHNGHYVEEKKKVSVVGARLKERVFLDQKGTGGFAVEAEGNFYYDIKRADFVFDKFNNELGENKTTSWKIKWSDKDGNVFSQEELNYGLGTGNHRKDPNPPERFYLKEIKPGINTVYLNLKLYGQEFDTTMPVTFFKETPDFRQINDEFAIKVNGMKPFVYLTGSEIRKKSKEEIDEILKNRLSFEYWDLKTGKQDIEKTNKIQFQSTSIKDEKSRGTFDITVTIDGKEFKIPNSVVVLPTNPNLSNDEISQYESLNFQTEDKNTVLINPFNNSRIGFPSRGLRNGNTEIGIRITDQFGYGPNGHNREQKLVPGIDPGNRVGAAKGVPVPLYTTENNLVDYKWGNRIITRNALNKSFEQDNSFEAIYTLKKDNKIMQLIVDNKNDVLYTYTGSFTRNFNSLLEFKMYNLKDQPRNMVLLEGNEANYYGGNTHIRALGGHRGMTYSKDYANYNGHLTSEELEPIKSSKPRQVLTEKWKDYKGDNLGDFKKYHVSRYNEITLGGNVAKFIYGNNLEKPGYEEDPRYAVDNAELTGTGGSFTYSSLATTIKPIGFDSYLDGTLEYFAGIELPLMESEIDPPKKSIYPEEYKKGEYDFNYTFSIIPDNAKLNIDFTYPNGIVDNKTNVEPNGARKKSHKDKYKVNKKNIHVKEDDPTDFYGSIDNHDIDVIATAVGGAYPGITSQENFYRLENIHMGVTPKKINIPLNGTFTQKAEDVVDHKTIIAKPGGKENKVDVEFKYWDKDKDELMTLSQVQEKYIKSNEIGIKKLYVKMIDKNITDYEKSVIVTVPVEIGNPKGLSAVANSPISLRYDEVKDLFNDDLYDLVIDKSKAKGYNNATGSSTGVEVRVNPDPTKTTLDEATLVEGGVYQVTIDAYDGNPDTSNNTPAVVEVRITGNLTANPVHQTIPIGKKLSEDEMKDFVKDVKSGNTPLDKDEYSVTLESKLPDVVSKNDTETVKVKVFEKYSPTKYEEVDVPITMTWGNSIAFGGDETGGRMGGGAYALHNDGTSGDAYISAVSGKVVSNDNEAIAKNHGDDYLSIGWYDLSQSGSTYVMSKDTQPSAPAVTAKGTDKKQDTLNKWGTNTVQAVKTGDLVRGWSAEAGKQYLTDKKQTEPKAKNNTDQEIFYEVTKNGYERLSFNQLKDGKIGPLVKYGTTEEELNKQALNGDFIQLKEANSKAKIVGFKAGHFPDTSKPTKVDEFETGILVIEEKLSSGKTVQYEVSLDFMILDGTLKFVSADDLYFGTREIRHSDVYYVPENKQSKIVVEDDRHTPKPWDLTATMEKALHYKEKNQEHFLKGSAILMLDSKGDKQLSENAVVIHETRGVEVSKGTHTISWDNQVNEGYRLFVKNNTAENNKKYQSTIVYGIDSKPTTRAVKNTNK